MKSFSLLSIFFVLLESKIAMGSENTVPKTGYDKTAPKTTPQLSSVPAARETGLAEKKKSQPLRFEAQGKRAKLLISMVETQLTFQVEAFEGLALSFDAPWALKLKPGQGSELKATQLSRKDFETSIPGFKVESLKKSSQLQFDYDLTAFICLADKTQCFREVLKGAAKIGS